MHPAGSSITEQHTVWLPLEKAMYTVKIKLYDDVTNILPWPQYQCVQNFKSSLLSSVDYILLISEADYSNSNM